MIFLGAQGCILCTEPGYIYYLRTRKPGDRKRGRMGWDENGSNWPGGDQQQGEGNDYWPIWAQYESRYPFADQACRFRFRDSRFCFISKSKIIRSNTRKEIHESKEKKIRVKGFVYSCQTNDSRQGHVGTQMQCNAILIVLVSLSPTSSSRLVCFEKHQKYKTIPKNRIEFPG